MSTSAPQLNWPHPPNQFPSPPWLFSPVLLLLQPNSGPQAGGNPVTLIGLGLNGATQVLFGSTPATIAGGDPLGFTLNVTAPPGTGTVPVTVVTPGGTSNPQTYTYLGAPPPPPVPTAVSILPTSGPTIGGTPFVITGTNLNGATVTFGGTPATVVFSVPGLVFGLTPPGAAGNVPVVVTTAGGTATVPGGYTYVGVVVTPPVITANVTPSTGLAAGGTPFVITGTNLTGATVTFGANLATILTNSGTVITGTTPPGTAATTVPVTVTTPGGTVSAGAYTYV
jgi:IPT/TIG domain